MLVRSKNYIYFLIGIVFMMLNKVRHSLMGYKTPRPFGIQERARCVEYDFGVVDGWLKGMTEHLGTPYSISGQNVLEIGPGADLGVGLILLAMGAAKYNAVDANPLVKTVPVEFYECLFTEIQKRIPDADIDYLREQLELCLADKEGRLNYVSGSSALFSKFSNDEIDIVFSQAAFEHIGDMESLVSNISRLAKKKAHILSVIDLQTHTRWLREKDPLNIYRYSDGLYSFFSFNESPNRLRPKDYTESFFRNGWTNVSFVPTRLISDDDLKCVKPYLLDRFRSCKDAGCLNGILFAVKE